MDGNTIAYVIAGILILVGVAGTILPALPGVPLVYAGMLLAAWTDGFQEVPVWVMVVLGAMTLLSLGIDFLATSLGAKRAGASKKAMIGAALGTFAGLVFGIPGLLLGPFIGAVAGEMIGGRQLREASKVGFGTWLGLALGAALKIALLFAMIGIFLTALFWK
jgi:uncharacterized protein YqgC (DUF456 family)